VFHQAGGRLLEALSEIADNGGRMYNKILAVRVLWDLSLSEFVDQLVDWSECFDELKHRVLTELWVSA
jgi:hypothetical protein